VLDSRSLGHFAELNSYRGGIVSPELAVTIQFQPQWKYERKTKQKETKDKNIPHGHFISTIHETSRRTTQVSTLKTKKFQTLGLVVSSFLRVPFFPPYNGITVLNFPFFQRTTT